jgi:hypothetical protein
MKIKILLCAAATLVAGAGCRHVGDTRGGASGVLAASSDQSLRDEAFKKVSPRLRALKAALPAVKVQILDVNKLSPDEVKQIVGLSNTLPGELNPPELRGVFWMRGNPLPDYLLSFSQTMYQEHNGLQYGYMPTFKPGSFAWKENRPAEGATDPSFVPPECRVPEKDPQIARLATLARTHDRAYFDSSVGSDMAALDDPSSPKATQGQIDKFLSFVWNTPQRPDDGIKNAMDLHAAQMYYEAAFPKSDKGDYRDAVVHVFPLDFHNPAGDATFSFASYPGDPDILLRKSWVPAAGKEYPNYYLLTRILREDGSPTDYYKDFVNCINRRSGGRIVKVVAGP